MPRRIPLPSAGLGASSPIRNGLSNVVRGLVRSARGGISSGNQPRSDEVDDPPTVERASMEEINPLLPETRHPPTSSHTREQRRAALDDIRRRINTRAAGDTSPQPKDNDSSSTNAAIESNERPTNHTVSPSSNFIDANRDYTPPDDSKYPPVPDGPRKVIALMLRQVWGIAPPDSPPREYQIQAIFYLVFLRMTMLYLIRKTGEGKSLVLLGMATMLRGVTVCLVPLLGVGSMHAANSRNVENRVEAYHVDEYKEADFTMIEERLRQYSPAERSSIILYISPLMLDPKTKWYKLLSGLASKGYISSICVDESHTTVEQGESFRPEFTTAVKSLSALRDVSKVHRPDKDIPFLVMSATFRIPEQQKFNLLAGQFPEAVIWGGMDRRSVRRVRSCVKRCFWPFVRSIPFF